MKRDEFLNSPDVIVFIDWSANLVNGEWGLTHEWRSKKHGAFHCKSLYAAFKRYGWEGEDFADTVEFFSERGCELRAALQSEDVKGFVTTALCICHWGGIYNLKSLQKLTKTGFNEIRKNVSHLAPKLADTCDLQGFNDYMGSGYSKVYAAIIEDFPIYDSRVACALTSLIHLFGRENRVNHELLSLGIPSSRGPDRNLYGFPDIWYTRKGLTLYAISNVKAGWILGEWANRVGNGPFRDVPHDRRVFALESSLFMLGYAPLKDDPVRKG